jgi:hypothetical protein
MGQGYGSPERTHCVFNVFHIIGTHAVYLSIPNNPQLELVTSSFHLAVGTICPFTIILVSNITIIVTLQTASKERKAFEVGTQSKAHDRIQKDTAHLTRMLIAVSMAYVILTLPYRLYHMIVKIPAIAALYDPKSLYWKMRFFLQAWNLMNVWNFNFAINFFLYCIGGGKRYRDDARDVLRKVRC